MISIAIVAEDGREYYAICPDFNVDEAWTRHEVIPANTAKNHSLFDLKEYWIRENVLYPIYKELSALENPFSADGVWSLEHPQYNYNSRAEFRRLVKMLGKSRGEIALDVWQFICEGQAHEAVQGVSRPAELYGYYSDYDHVALSWLFGRMINLPKEFPMYTRDLKQILDEKVEAMDAVGFLKDVIIGNIELGEQLDFATRLTVKSKEWGYPQQTNERNAFADARWDKQLYDFIQTL